MESLKAQVLATAIAMNDSGINRGSAGNVSARSASGFIITPTGMAYADCDVADMVSLDADGVPSVGADNTASQRRQPSSEWRFHTHAPFATALACQGMSIPAFHYMVAKFGGNDVRCAAYATFGTQELSDAILMALRDRCACLMANHGMVVYGKDLKQALALAIELECLAEQYWRVIQLGAPTLLSDNEMERVLLKFANYGQQT